MAVTGIRVQDEYLANHLIERVAATKPAQPRLRESTLGPIHNFESWRRLSNDPDAMVELLVKQVLVRGRAIRNELAQHALSPKLCPEVYKVELYQWHDPQAQEKPIRLMGYPVTPTATDYTRPKPAAQQPPEWLRARRSTIRRYDVDVLTLYANDSVLVCHRSLDYAPPISTLSIAPTEPQIGQPKSAIEPEYVQWRHHDLNTSQAYKQLLKVGVLLDNLLGKAGQSVNGSGNNNSAEEIR